MFNPIQKLLNTKFRNKLIFMCIAVIVPITLAGVFLLYNLIDLMRTNAGNEAIFEADGLKTRLKDTITTVSNISDRLYESNILNDIVNGSFTENDEYYDLNLQNQPVSEYIKSYPQIDNVRIYIDSGNIARNEYLVAADNDIKNTYWYRETSSAVRPKWQIILVDDDVYRLALISPITDENGTFRGALTVTVNPKWFGEITKDTNSKVVLTTSNNVVFYSTLENYSPGTVINNNDFNVPLGVSDSEILDTETNPFRKIGYAVISYFDYENAGNPFQVYIIKPNFLFNDATKNTIFTYTMYIFLCIVLSVLLTILFASMFSRRIQFLKNQMHSAASGNFELAEDIKGTDEIYDLYVDLKKMVDSMQKLINDAYKAKIRSESFKLNQIEAEFKTLASQINPHFLYNTLETIRMKAYCNNDKETADLVKKLGKFMRRCLEIKDGMVTLESELEFTRSYLELQSARFGDRISYSIYCEVSRSYKILPLIIQPIVENAFAHGIESAKANGKIAISVRYKGENIEINVSDNGQGITPERLEELLEKLRENDTSSGKSIGLTNVNKRIKMYHGDEYGLSIKTAVGNGTTVTITLPRIVDENTMKILPEKYREISENISSKLDQDQEV